MRRSSHSHAQLEAKTFKMALIQMIKPIIWLAASLVALILVSGIGYHHMTSPLPIRWASEQDAFVHGMMSDFNARGSLAAWRKELRETVQEWIDDRRSYFFLEKHIQSIWDLRRFDFQTLQFVNYTVVSRKEERIRGEIRVTNGRVTLAAVAEPLIFPNYLRKTSVEGEALRVTSLNGFTKLLTSPSPEVQGSILWIHLGIGTLNNNPRVITLLQNAQDLGANGAVIVENGRISTNFHLTGTSAFPIFLLRHRSYETLAKSFPAILANSSERFTTTLRVMKPKREQVTQGHFLGYFNGGYAPGDYVVVTNVNRTISSVDAWVEEVAILLELARLFGEMVLQNKWRPHRTVIFCIILPLDVSTSSRRSVHSFVSPYLTFLRSKTIGQIQIHFDNRSTSLNPGTLHLVPSLFAMANYSLDHVAQIFNTVGEIHDLPNLDDNSPVTEIDCFGASTFLRYSMYRDTEVAGYVLAYHINYLTSNFLLPLNITHFAERIRDDFEYKIYSQLFTREDKSLTRSLEKLRRALDGLVLETSRFQDDRVSKLIITEKNISLLGHWGIISLEVANKRLTNVISTLAGLQGGGCVQSSSVQCGIQESCYPKLSEMVRKLIWGSLTTTERLRLIESVIEEIDGVEYAITTVLYSLNL